MKHDQTADAGIQCQLPDLCHEGMSPAVFVRHIRFQVLGVVYQDIDSLAEIHPLVV